MQRGEIGPEELGEALRASLPVAAGCRLTLVFNLSREGPGSNPIPPSYSNEQDRLAKLMVRWEEGKERAEDGLPEKLVYPLEHLEHIYTAASSSFEVLKGADAAKAATLLAAAKEAGCDLRLALVSIEERGSADHIGNYRGYGAAVAVMTTSTWARWSNEAKPPPSGGSPNAVPWSSGFCQLLTEKFLLRP